eukprot:symbB.v1.2.000547.t1/scaffold19.1/size443072/11
MGAQCGVATLESLSAAISGAASTLDATVRLRQELKTEILEAFEEKLAAVSKDMTSRSKTMEEAFEEKMTNLNKEITTRSKTLEEAMELQFCTEKQAAQEMVDTLAMEMKTRVVELEEALESKLSSQREACTVSIREQSEEFDGRMAYEVKSLRQELDVNSESLRLELQTCLTHKISDEVTRPMDEIRRELRRLDNDTERHSTLMEEHEQRQVDVRGDMDRLRQEVSSNAGKLVQLSDLKFQTEDQVRRHISELLTKAKADFREQLQPFSPIERRLEQLAIEVSRHQTMAERAREELGGILRAEMQSVALEAASKQRKLVDQELRSILDLQQRQFTEALEAAASRASCELKEISGCHGKEVRALASRLQDAEHFSQQARRFGGLQNLICLISWISQMVGFAVREIQKHRVKALENGSKKVTPSSDEVVLKLQQEIHSFARYTEAKTKELYQAFTDLKATSSQHAQQLNDLSQEALVMNQRLDTALLLDASKIERDQEAVSLEDASPQWTEAVKGMETLTDIVGSLEREGPTSPASLTAVRRELQEELQQVWQALRDVQSGRSKFVGENSSTLLQAMPMPPKAHQRSPKERSQVSSDSYESYSEEEKTKK